MQTPFSFLYIFIRVDGMNVCLKLSEIIYLESLGKQVKVVTSKGTFLPYATLIHLEKGLYPGFFWRVHRSFIINALHIHHILEGEIHLGDYIIPIGESYEKQVTDNSRPINS